MNSPASAPLGPLPENLVRHLTELLGAPQEFLATIRDGRDLYAMAWLVGRGEVSAETRPGTTRGTTVEIRLTPGGSLVTTRTAWTRHRDGGGSDSATGRAHPTPQSALDWLIEDGDGKLGPASKDAWVQACNHVPPMSHLAVERVE